ncbi:NADH-quinone oxidoreductase subunit L [Thiomicrorhabdus sp. 6S2-11]|uniref:Probable inorganic carbon transporter subunit DabB n=1 Tax=Thiomicrorhabdus marina TaxID=2818442 RepID=A0ABS3Q3T7_9GAMM|nr:NADH-quinone oxidoreductase subunit L [Thiomicrorhabdus marina]MBO1926823.1 NADH-quinone oxidoreductase subunit L [Thiomicrorhabdus marina]
MTSAWIGSLLLLAIPGLFFVTSWAHERRANWNVTMAVALIGLVISASSGFLAIAGIVEFGHGFSWVTHEPVSLVMLSLISFIAYINVRYSRAYMAGNREEEKRYIRWLSITLGFVTLVVVSNHMMMMLVAWIGISVALHQLLIFYPERQRAVLAAHKKYIFARIAEICLFGGVMILYYQHDTWLISDIYANLSQAETLTYADQIAALFLAAAALVKCAQLPLHGWLIQVVEAPTPVSALLHAGIINLGGFLMIVFAPLLILSSAAQWLLLIIGGLTTVLAALVMMTRATVKVRLAWSTMSQMGLMLVECALGLFELALLHLIAHSCYKAYAFLNSGTEVESTMKKRLSKSVPPTRADWWMGAILAGALVIALIVVAQLPAPYSPWILLAIALTLLIAERRGRLSTASVFSMVGLAAILLAAYTLQKMGIHFIVEPKATTVGMAGDIWMGVLFIAFFAGYILLRYHRDNPAMVSVWRSFYAGFYLDEFVTRLNLRLYPTRLPVRFKPKHLKIPKEELFK